MPPRAAKIQPSLFDFPESAVGEVELFPAVWNAMESLTSSDVVDRKAGLNQIIELDAHRLSPLAAYVLATFLEDPNIGFRFQVVQVVGSLLQRESSEKTTEEVKQALKTYLSQMRQRSVYALLQVGEDYDEAKDNIAALLKACSYAGKVLSDIFMDRKLPLGIRGQAVYFAGKVGFMETAPRLERLASRLEGRLNGQGSMSFAPLNVTDESPLLETIQAALSILNSN